MDKYTKKYIRLIKKAESDQELSDIVDKIYTDGFDDGEWETEQPPTTPQNKEPDTETTQDNPLTEIEKNYQKELLILIDNMESDGLSDTTITSILKQGSQGYI